MRGQVDPQSGMFSYFSVEERIPADHPLRRVKAQADTVLASMSTQFDEMYATVGRLAFATAPASAARSAAGTVTWRRLAPSPNASLQPLLLNSSAMYNTGAGALPEIQQQLRYLDETPVRETAELIRAGRYVLRNSGSSGFSVGHRIEP